MERTYPLVSLILAGCMHLSATHAFAHVIVEYELDCHYEPDDGFAHIEDIVLRGEDNGTVWPMANWFVCNTSAKFDLSLLLYEDFVRQGSDPENFVHRTLPKKTCVNIVRTQDVHVKTNGDEATTGLPVDEKVVVLACKS